MFEFSVISGDLEEGVLCLLLDGAMSGGDFDMEGVCRLFMGAMSGDLGEGCRIDDFKGRWLK